MNKEKDKTTPKNLKNSNIKVIGVGGAGVSVIRRMTEKNLKNVDYLVIDTDEQALNTIDKSEVYKIQIGKSLTKGDGTGMDIEKGKKSALEEKKDLEKAIKGAGIIFVSVGLGGGTGSGAGPVIADVCKKTNALVVGVLTKPFNFEGKERLRLAKKALDSFKDKLDAFVTISNSRIMQIIERKTSINKAFDIVDEAVRDGISLFADILNKTGTINVNLSDVVSILKGAGPIFLGSGKVSLQDQAKEAGTRALENPLIEDLVPQKAKNVLFVVNGPESLPMSEVNSLAKRINKELRPDAKIIFGAVVEKNRQNIGVTLIGTNFKNRFQNSNGHKKRKKISHQNHSSDKDKKKVHHKKVKPKREVKAYGEDDFETKKDFIEKGDFEDELEIPAFLRKKLKK